MELSLIDLLTGPMVVGARVSGLMVFAPFFGNSAIPVRIKAVLAVVITAVLYPVYSARVGVITLLQWPGVVARELMLGVVMGLAANFVFEAAQMAGQVFGVQMGYSLVNILDPQTQVDTTVVALFHQTVAFLFFLQLNVHHWILRGIAHSFEYLSPGAVHLSRGLTAELLHGAAACWDRASDRRPGPGSDPDGRRDSGFSGQSFPANASDASWPRSKAVGSGLMITAMLLAGLV